MRGRTGDLGFISACYNGVRCRENRAAEFSRRGIDRYTEAPALPLNL